MFPLGDLLSFSLLVSLATLWRRRPDRHKRLILLATVSLMGAPLAHVVGQVPALHAFPPVILLPLAAFYFAAAIHDRWTDGRVHPISLWGAIAPAGLGPGAGRAGRAERGLAPFRCVAGRVR